MRVSLHLFIKVVAIVSYFLVNAVYAQDAEKKPDAKPTASEIESAVDKAAVEKKNDGEPATKKMVQNATINLQTTVTGNQEQPRVLYILPWQSPQAANVDFESLDNEQKAVFGHVEREELRRELESAGEL
jgi:hypothetical protein